MVHDTGQHKSDNGYRESPTPKIRKKRQRNLVGGRRDQQVLDGRESSAPSQSEAYRRRNSGNGTVS